MNNTAHATAPPNAALLALQGALQRATGEAFRRANAAGQQARSNVLGLSMSALGVCDRQAAYRLAGTDPSDLQLSQDEEARQALIGVWIHAGLLPFLADVLYDAQYEVPVELRVRVTDDEEVVVPGTTDLYCAALGGGIIDLKTVGAHLSAAYGHTGARHDHRTQVHGYALAAQQKGLPVAWTAWAYLDRDTGETMWVIEPFGEDEAEAVRERVRHLHRAATTPDGAPRSQRGPGLSVVCDRCPWLRRCWGPDARPGDTGALAVHSQDDIAFAARKYIELREQKSAIEKEMEKYGAMVGTPPQGHYGPVVVSYGRSSQELDKKRAADVMRLHGIDPPMKLRRGSRTIRWGRKESE